MITTNYLLLLKLLAVLGCGLVAGVFFAFSTFVMPALARLEQTQGIVAMQSINIKAINPLFMVALFGTALICLAIAVCSLLNWQQANILLLIGSLLYLLGTVGVTIACNVPLNNALAIAKVEDLASTKLWAEYLSNWTFWNHIRTIAASIATVLLAIALYD